MRGSDSDEDDRMVDTRAVPRATADEDSDPENYDSGDDVDEEIYEELVRLHLLWLLDLLHALTGGFS